MKKYLILLALLPFFLASCSSFVSDFVSPSVEYDLHQGMNTLTENSMTTKTNSKKAAKEQEQLKKEGKCPTCHGAGKTIDGKYECPTCKGTGKAE